MSEARRASFIVRLVRDPQGKVSGLIERVATGAKAAFQGVEMIGPVIAAMLQREGADRPTRRAPAARSRRIANRTKEVSRCDGS